MNHDNCLETEPFFSILTPVFNRADVVDRCITSVLNQGFASFELVITDDGSSDASCSVMGQFVDSRVQLHRLGVNRGVNAARNHSVRASAGKYLLFLDSDDWLVEGALSHVWQTIQNNPDYHHYLFLVDDRKEEPLPRGNTVRYEDWLSGAISGDFLHVVKRGCFNEYPFFEQFRAQEYLNWLRVFRAFSPQFLDKSVMVGRERNRTDALTNTLTLDNIPAFSKLFDESMFFFDLYGGDLFHVCKTAYYKRLFNGFLCGVVAKRFKENSNFVKQRSFMFWVLFGCLNNNWGRAALVKLISLKKRRNIK